MKWSLLSRFLVLFLAIIFVFSGIYLISVWRLHSIGRSFQDLKDHYLTLNQIISQIETFEQNQFQLLKRGINHPQDQLRVYLFESAIPKNIATIHSKIQEIENFIKQILQKKISSEEQIFFKNLLIQCKQIQNENINVEGAVTDLLQSNRSQAETQREINDLENKIYREVYLLKKMLQNKIEVTTSNIANEEKKSVWLMIAAWLVALIFSLIIVFFIHRFFQPINILSSAIRSAQSGNITALEGLNVPYREFQELFAEIVQLSKKLIAKEQELKEQELELFSQSRALKDANRQLSQMKLFNENVIQSVNHGIVVTNENFQITLCNSAANNVLFEKDLVGKNLLELPFIIQIPIEKKQLDDMLFLKKKSLVFQACQLKDSYLNTLILPFLDEEHLPRGLVIVFEDVTLSTQMRTKLIRSERLATIGRMSAQITHEIRNPLSSIGLNVELIADELTGIPSDQKTIILNRIHSISQEIDRLEEITNDYLQFSKMPETQKKEVSLSIIITDLILFLKNEYRLKNITIECQVEENLGLVLGDDDQLKQAFLNILKNSYEALHEGGTITITVSEKENEQHVVFSDNGQGVSQENFHRVMEPFFTTKEKGTGLGMAITQQIIIEHSAKISYKNLLPQGFSVHLIFPIITG